MGSADVIDEKTIGQVDVAFVIDTTGSMASYIDEARRHASDTAQRLADEGGLDMRCAVVGYRDHPPEDLTYVTSLLTFESPEKLSYMLGTFRASGGGDTPEAVWDGVLSAASLQWRSTADKLIFLIGDAPPHGVGYPGDRFAKGCPCGLTGAGLSELLGSLGITLHAHSIAGDSIATDAFRTLAEATGGTCTEVDRPEMMTRSYEGTLSSTSGSIGSSREYLRAAAAAPGASYSVITEGLGWSAEKSATTAEYLARRGHTVVDPEKE